MNSKYIYSEKNLMKHKNTKWVQSKYRDTVDEAFFYLNEEGKFNIPGNKNSYTYAEFKKIVPDYNLGSFKNPFTGTSFRTACTNSYTKGDYSASSEWRDLINNMIPEPDIDENLYSKVIDSVARNTRKFSMPQWVSKHLRIDIKEAERYLTEAVSRGDLICRYEANTMNDAFEHENHYYVTTK